MPLDLSVTSVSSTGGRCPWCHCRRDWLIALELTLEFVVIDSNSASAFASAAAIRPGIVTHLSSNLAVPPPGASAVILLEVSHKFRKGGNKAFFLAPWSVSLSHTHILRGEDIGSKCQGKRRGELGVGRFWEP